MGKFAYRKLRWAIYYMMYRMDPQQTNNKICLHTNLNKTQRTLHGLASSWEHQEKHTIIAKSILCKRYTEIVFQKVALGYVLHFVQNGPSKNIINTIRLHNNIKTKT